MITINLNQLDGEFINHGIYYCKERVIIEDSIQCRVILVYLHELPIREATQDELTKLLFIIFFNNSPENSITIFIYIYTLPLSRQNAGEMRLKTCKAY